MQPSRLRLPLKLWFCWSLPPTSSSFSSSRAMLNLVSVRHTGFWLLRHGRYRIPDVCHARFCPVFDSLPHDLILLMHGKCVWGSQKPCWSDVGYHSNSLVQFWCVGLSAARSICFARLRLPPWSSFAHGLKSASWCRWSNFGSRCIACFRVACIFLSFHFDSVS
jgi:hypothetical protein